MPEKFLYFYRGRGPFTAQQLEYIKQQEILLKIKMQQEK